MGSETLADPLVQAAVIAFVSLVTLVVSASKDKISLALSLAIFLALMPRPTVLPSQLATPVGPVFISDLGIGILVVSLLASATSLPSLARNVATFFAVIVAGGVVVGIANGATLAAAMSDARGFVYSGTIAVGVIGGIVDSRQATIRRMILAANWIAFLSALSAAVAAFTSATVFDVRAGEAAIYTASGVSSGGTLRVIPPGGLFTVLYASVVTALLLTNSTARSHLKAPALVVSSGVVVLALGFSRNNLIGVVLVLASFICMHRARLQFVARAIGVLLVGAIAIAAAAGASGRDSPVRMGVASISETFEIRVIGGLRPTTLATDASANWRLRESELALASFRERPLLGTGFGAHYRDRVPNDPFSGQDGLTYVHNAYLSAVVKLGIFGLAPIIGMILLVLRLRLGSKEVGPTASSLRTAMLAVWIAIGAILVVSPLPFARSGAVVFGILVGASAVLGMAVHSPQAGAIGRYPRVRRGG